MRLSRVTLSLLFVACVGAGVPAAAAPKKAADPLRIESERFALKNGLSVILVEDHSVPRVHMSLRVRTGSSWETPGRTGFAHLFEHLMFEGSKNVPEGKFDEWLEAAGGENNAWTSEDITYYYEEGPSNALDLMLFLESDRLGFFLDKLDATLVDGQRDVVKNERRQSYENRPYGTADLSLNEFLYPKGHPYSWPVIGSMKDLTAASVDDVRSFFLSHYTPENCILTLVGDFETKAARAAVEKWFSDVPSRGGRPAPAPAPIQLAGEKRAVFEDDVELPRLSFVWPSAPAYAPDDASLDLLAAVLAGGESSRLVKRLVHEMQVAQSVSAMQMSHERASEFAIEVYAFPGTKLTDIARAVDEEVARLLREGPTEAELARARAGVESNVYDTLDSLSGKANSISTYAMTWGDPDSFGRDLQRYRDANVDVVRGAAKRTFTRGRVVMSVVPKGALSLAVINPILPVVGGVK